MRDQSEDRYTGNVSTSPTSKSSCLLIIPDGVLAIMVKLMRTIIGTRGTRSTRYMSCAPARRVAVGELSERKYACAWQLKADILREGKARYLRCKWQSEATSFRGKFPFVNARARARQIGINKINYEAHVFSPTKWINKIIASDYYTLSMRSAKKSRSVKMRLERDLFLRDWTPTSYSTRGTVDRV